MRANNSRASPQAARLRNETAEQRKSHKGAASTGASEAATREARETEQQLNHESGGRRWQLSVTAARGAVEVVSHISVMIIMTRRELQYGTFASC